MKLTLGKLGTVWMLLGSVALTACGDDNEPGGSGGNGGASNGGTSGSAGRAGANSAGRAGSGQSGAEEGGAIDPGDGGEGGAVEPIGGSGGNSSGAGGKSGSGGTGGSAGKSGSGGTGGSAGKSGGGGMGGSAGKSGGGGMGGGGTSGGGTGGIVIVGGTGGGGTGGTGGGVINGGSGGSSGGGSAWPNDCVAGTWCKLAAAPIDNATTALNPTDSSVWIVGKISAALTVGGTTLTPAAGGSWALLHYDQYGQLLGAFKTADTVDALLGAPSVTSVVVDAQGNLYVFGGGMLANVSFPTSTTPTTLTFLPGGGDRSDSLLLKLDAQGRYLWGFNFKTGDGDEATIGRLDTNGTRLALALKASQNINLTQVGVGTKGTGALVGGGTTEAPDVGVFALDAATGAFQWAKVFGDGVAGSEEQSPVCVQVDSTGDIIVGGNFYTAINFNAGVSGSVLTSSTGFDQDGFLAKLTGANGAHSWSQRVATGGGLVHGCKLNPARTQLFTFGSFVATSIAFGAGAAIANPSASGGLHYFLAHLNGAGAHVYSSGFVLPVITAAGDASGGFSIVGTPQAPLNLGGGTALSGTLVGKYSAAGAYQDSQSLGAGILRTDAAVGDSDAAFVFANTQSQAQVWRYRP